MSLLLLIGLVQSEMDEKGYVFKQGCGWIDKEADKPLIVNDSKPFERKKRLYKRIENKAPLSRGSEPLDTPGEVKTS